MTSTRTPHDLLSSTSTLDSNLKEAIEDVEKTLGSLEPQRLKLTFVEALGKESSSTKFVWDHYHQAQKDVAASFGGKSKKLLLQSVVAGVLAFLGVAKLTDVAPAAENLDKLSQIVTSWTGNAYVWVILLLAISFALSTWSLYALIMLIRRYFLYDALRPLPLNIIMFDATPKQKKRFSQQNYDYKLCLASDAEHAERLARYLDRSDRSRIGGHDFGAARMLLIAFLYSLVLIFSGMVSLTAVGVL